MFFGDKSRENGIFEKKKKHVKLWNNQLFMTIGGKGGGKTQIKNGFNGLLDTNRDLFSITRIAHFFRIKPALMVRIVACSWRKRKPVSRVLFKVHFSVKISHFFELKKCKLKIKNIKVATKCCEKDEFFIAAKKSLRRSLTAK